MYLKTNITKLRNRHGLSQHDLSDDLQLDPTTISKYESGERTPSIEILIKLANYFNVTIDTLLFQDVKQDGVVVTQSEARDFYNQLAELKNELSIKSFFLGQCRRQNEKQVALLKEFAIFIKWKLRINPASITYRNFEEKLCEIGFEVKGYE